MQLVIMATFWNDMDWLQASLNYLERWCADKIYLCEGCFDKNYPARSTDGTREFIEKYQKTHKNVWIVDNARTANYRQNQANTGKLVTRLSEMKHGDWIMRVDCDFFIYQSDIDLYKQYIEENVFDYPRFEERNFWDSSKLYHSRWSNQNLNLPWRFVEGAYWIPTFHLCLKGKQYHESPHVRQKTLKISGYHYEGFRSKERLKDKYAVGDRQSPTVWNNGIKLKKRLDYNGYHPEFVRKVLKQKGFI